MSSWGSPVRQLSDGWFEYGGGGLAHCPGTKLVRGEPRPCNRWLFDVGEGQVVRVRVHPQSGRVHEPKPTRSDLNVMQCHRCESHLEVAVHTASAAVA